MSKSDDAEQFPIAPIEACDGRNDAMRVQIERLRELDQKRWRILDDAWREAPNYGRKTVAELEKMHALKVDALENLAVLFELAEMYEYAALSDRMAERLRQEGPL